MKKRFLVLACLSGCLFGGSEQTPPVTIENPDDTGQMTDGPGVFDVGTDSETTDTAVPIELIEADWSEIDCSTKGGLRGTERFWEVREQKDQPKPDSKFLTDGETVAWATPNPDGVLVTLGVTGLLNNNWRELRTATVDGAFEVTEILSIEINDEQSSRSVSFGTELGVFECVYPSVPSIPFCGPAESFSELSDATNLLSLENLVSSLVFNDNVADGSQFAVFGSGPDQNGEKSVAGFAIANGFFGLPFEGATVADLDHQFFPRAVIGATAEAGGFPLVAARLPDGATIFAGDSGGYVPIDSFPIHPDAVVDDGKFTFTESTQIVGMLVLNQGLTIQPEASRITHGYVSLDEEQTILGTRELAVGWDLAFDTVVSGQSIATELAEPILALARGGEIYLARWDLDNSIFLSPGLSQFDRIWRVSPFFFSRVASSLNTNISYIGLRNNVPAVGLRSIQVAPFGFADRDFCVSP